VFVQRRVRPIRAKFNGSEVGEIRSGPPQGKGVAGQNTTEREVHPHRVHEPTTLEGGKRLRQNSSGTLEEGKG